MFAPLLLAATCACSKPESLKVDLCSPTNVVKALKLAEQFLPEEPIYSIGSGTVLYSNGTVTWDTLSSRAEQYKPGDNKRKEAQALLDEADKLDKRQEDATFIRKVLKSCDE